MREGGGRVYEHSDINKEGVVRVTGNLNCGKHHTYGWQMRCWFIGGKTYRWLNAAHP